MPANYMYETAVTVDHEDGTCLVDTTVRGIASQLVRRGFVEITTSSSHPYRRFKGLARQIRFGPVEKRRMADSQGFKKRSPDTLASVKLEPNFPEEGREG